MYFANKFVPSLFAVLLSLIRWHVKLCYMHEDIYTVDTVTGIVFKMHNLYV